MSCRQIQEDVAVALLERADLEASDVDHVNLCPACAAEQASLRQVTAVMALASADDMRPVESMPAGDLLLQRILQATSAERVQVRRHTILIRGLAIAAAAVVAVVGIAVGLDILAPDSHVITASASAAGLQGTADIAPTVGGSELRISMTGVPEDTDCVIVVRSSDGRTQVIAKWRAEYEGTAHVVGNATAAPETITNVTLTKADGSVLLDIPVVA